MKLRCLVAEIPPAAQLAHPAEKLEVRLIIIGIQGADPEKRPGLPVQAAPDEVPLKFLEWDAVALAIEFAEGFQVGPG